MQDLAKRSVVPARCFSHGFGRWLFGDAGEIVRGFEETQETVQKGAFCTRTQDLREPPCHFTAGVLDPQAGPHPDEAPSDAPPWVRASLEAEGRSEH